MNDPERQNNAPRKGRRAWRTDQQWDGLRARLNVANGEGTSPNSANLSDAHPKRWRRYSTIAVAACAVIAVALSVRSRKAPTSVEWTTVSTAPGQRDTVRLSDSTTILLGPSTTIRYALTDHAREVTLDGLAHFSVVHNASRPFRVSARNAVATDIGTEFVVRSYNTDSVVRVSVTSGSVSLGDSVTQSLTLGAGAVGEVSSNGQTRLSGGLGANASDAWRNDQLLFNNEALRDVATELGRWFNVRVKISDPALGNRRITAVYSASTLNAALDALAATVGARYEHVGDTITIRPVKQ